MDELNEMKEQMTTLKQTLDNIVITNDRLLKKVISQKMTMFNRIVWTECAIFPFIIILLLGMCLFFDISLWLTWSFGLLALADIICDFKTLRISDNELANTPFMKLRDKLIRQKKQRRVQNSIVFPLTMGWTIWLIVALLHSLEIKLPSELMLPVRIGLICCGIAGLVFAIWLVLKTDKNTDSMVAEIDDNDLH